MSFWSRGFKVQKRSLDLEFLKYASSDVKRSITESEMDMREILSLLNEGDSFLNEGTDKEEDDKPMNKQQLLAKIREKKEVIEKLRCQPWPMKRKRRTLKLAQKYLQRYEPEVSKGHIILEALRVRWKRVKRRLVDFGAYLIPWESKIKSIESRFGSVVSSYFIFLRWILALNFVISICMLAFIVVPEVLTDKLTDRLKDENKTEIYRHRKFLSQEKGKTADQLQVLWDFQGKLSKSALFLGYYSNETWLVDEFKYRLPMTYFLINVLLYGLSFFVVLRKMAANARLNKMSNDKTEQYPFSWKVFTGWDYMIGVTETASNAIMANVMKFKESMTGHKEKQKEKFQWLLFFRRILANCIIVSMIGFSTFLINNVVERSVKIEDENYKANSFEKNEVPIVVSIITLIYPNLFELLSNFLERFHPRIALRLQLGRILALYLLNFYTLIFALNNKMNKYREKQEAYNANASLRANLDMVTPAALSSGRFDSDYYQNFNFADSPYFDAENIDSMHFLSESELALYNEMLTSAIDLFNRTFSLLPKSTLFTYHSVPLLSVINILYSNVHKFNPSLFVEYDSYNSSTDWSMEFEDYEYDDVTNEDSDGYQNSDDLKNNGNMKFDREELGIKDIDKMTSAEMDNLLEKLRIGRFDRMSFDERVSFRQKVVTGPFSVTTINPIFGKIGINNTVARVKHNVTRQELKNLLLLEIRIKNGLKPTGSKLKPNQSQVEQPIIIPIVGYVMEKISSVYHLKNLNKIKNSTLNETKLFGDKGVRLANETEEDSLKIDDSIKILNIPGITNVITKKPRNNKGNKREKDGRSTRITSKLTQEDYEFLCWESMIGQEVCKLITMDLVMTVLSILFVDFFRGLWVRYCARWWCWNLETIFPEYGEFKVAENVLHLINNQGMIWLGLFFAPLLPALNNIKIIIILYMRAWAVVTCNVPAARVFRASRSSNFYLMLLLLMLFLCTLPVGYLIATTPPSKTCGPFGGRTKFWSVITDELPDDVYKQLDHFSSPGVVIPVFVLLVLIVYFLVSLIRGLREANEDLQKQLIHERTEEKRKVYRMADLGKKKYNDERGSMALPNPHHRGDDSDFGLTRRETWHPARNVALMNKVLKEFKRGASSKDDKNESDSPLVVKRSLVVVPELEPPPPDTPQPKHAPRPEGASNVTLFVPMLKCLPEESKSTSSDQSENELSSPKAEVPSGAPDAEKINLVVNIFKKSLKKKAPNAAPAAEQHSLRFTEPHLVAFEMKKPLMMRSLSRPEDESAKQFPMIGATRLSFDFNPKEPMTPPLAGELFQTPLQNQSQIGKESTAPSSGTDTETVYDSGRATMEDRSSTGYGPTATPSATETDTGTESEIEQRLIKKPSSSYRRPKLHNTLAIGFYNSVSVDEEDDEPAKVSFVKNKDVSSNRKLPITDLIMATAIVPWPPQPEDGRAGLKPVEPPEAPPVIITPIPTLSEVPSTYSLPRKAPRFKISVSPVRSSRHSSSSPELGIGNRRPFIIRQSVSRTPSPGPASDSLPKTSPLMTQSAYAALPSTSGAGPKLTVIDEGLSADRSRPILRPKKRGTVTFSPTEDQDLIFFDPQERTMNKQRTISLTNDNRTSSNIPPVSDETKKNFRTSKETVI